MFLFRQRRMYETGIFDVSQFYDSNFLIRTLSDIKNKGKSLTSGQNTITDLDQFKSKKGNKFNIIYIDLKLEHFELAIKFWLISFGIAFACLICEIIMYFVNKFYL